MSDQFLGEIRAFGCNYAPYGWALCAGQIMAIQQNTALFSILGVNYGGNGTTTFALPNLQDQIAVGAGDQGAGLSYWYNGDQSGSASVTLLQTEMPLHTHGLNANAAPANAAAPENGQSVLARSVGGQAYSTSASPLALLAPTTVALAGGSQPHNNMQPYLAMNYCIALSGIYPSRG